MKPILFSTPMVQAILEGRKTQTRRVVRRKGYDEKIHQKRNDYACHELDNLWQIGYQAEGRGWPQQSVGVIARHMPGDILYVRETWMPETEQGIPTGGNIYKATNNPIPDGDCPLRWHPSIHMPKESCPTVPACD